MGMTDDGTGTKAKVVKSRVVLVLTIFSALFLPWVRQKWRRT
jgi:hypothetical protein